MKGTVTSKGQLVIPAELRRRLRIQQGTHVRFEPISGGIAIYPEFESAIDGVRGILSGLSLPPNVEREPDREIE